MAEKDELSSAEMGQGHDLTLTHSNTAVSMVDGSEQLHRGMKSRHIQFMALGGA
jgi:amino acid permease